MYWADHAPPHFHAVYGGDEASIAIDSLVVLRGTLPPRALSMTLEWAAAHQTELLEDWALCAANKIPKSIEPLR